MIEISLIWVSIFCMPLFVYYMSWGFIFIISSIINRDNNKNVTAPAIQYHLLPVNTKNYKELLETRKNEFCGGGEAPPTELWKKRILIEFIPERGNIIMNYDIIRGAFTYYSDTQSIPYDILNNVVRKYVIIFCCCSFFVDGTPVKEILQVDNSIKSNVMYKTKNTYSMGGGGKGNIMGGGGGRSGNGAGGIVTNQSNKKPVTTIVTLTPELQRNKIIRIGKVNDFYFLNKDKVIKPDKIINYKDYKHIKPNIND